MSTPQSAAELRKILGSRKIERVVVLGHFYQREEVVRHADYVGDSFQLANAAKARTDAEAIVFCGVHFMAETAKILNPSRTVVLPDRAASCSLVVPNSCICRLAAIA